MSEEIHFTTLTLKWEIIKNAIFINEICLKIAFGAINEIIIGNNKKYSIIMELMKEIYV